MNLNERNIFLLDGVGALVSALCTGVVLPLLVEWIGLPLWSLYVLAAFPVLFAMYSLSCFFFTQTIKPWMLKTIIFANVFYCALSGMVLLVFKDITLWGYLFFIGEIFIILGIVTMEIKIYRRQRG